MMSGEGLFLLTVQGSGLLLLSSFGAIHAKDLAPGEEYIVDTGHIVAFEELGRIPAGEGDGQDAGDRRVPQGDGPVGPLGRGLRLPVPRARPHLHPDPPAPRLRPAARPVPAHGRLGRLS